MPSWKEWGVVALIAGVGVQKRIGAGVEAGRNYLILNLVRTSSAAGLRASAGLLIDIPTRTPFFPLQACFHSFRSVYSDR